MRIPWERIERLLLHVQRPGRYVGEEVNVVRKDWDATPIRVCLAFPDIYDLGMSNLGIQVLYDILNRVEGVLAERTYAPWPDMAVEMRRAGVPLYSLESFHAVADFDILGFSLPYEVLYTNLLEMLDLAGLPLLSVERDERHPLVVAGGHATFNPEPMADFVDAFVIGDGEEVVVELVEAYRRTRDRSREEQLSALARIEGVYVPRFYDVAYNPDGTVAEVRPNRPNVRLPIRRRIVPVLPPPPTRQLVPNVSVTHDRGVIEIQRGCTRGCRFCHAGMVTRPVRERPLEEILKAVDEILAQTGYEEIALLSLSSADYSRIGELVQALNRRYGGQHLSISLPSLRIESFSVDLADGIGRGRRTGFTFAPEAGTERMRSVINKPIPTGQMLEVAREVFARGWRTVKLYFMIGLPGETWADVEAIADLTLAVRAEGRRVHGRRAQVNVSVSTFVPKPHTPFQWAPLASLDEIRAKQQLLQRRLRGGGLKISWNEPRMSLLEAVLSRGDRRLGQVVRRAWEQGARFDGWDEWFDWGAWAAALAEAGLDAGFYAHRQRGLEEVFPWDHIQTGVRKGYLRREWERSRRAEPLPDCRGRTCYGCGILTAYGAMRTPGWGCVGHEQGTDLRTPID
ncbi:MAG TPA: TIGR03960 family B12-binding radical SAM protein [Anaerolineae bacterium]|nr:TIGR03960 family B12-binding radical SAM protein [Anaerolineae bacterium]